VKTTDGQAMAICAKSCSVKDLTVSNLNLNTLKALLNKVLMFGLFGMEIK